VGRQQMRYPESPSNQEAGRLVPDDTSPQGRRAGFFVRGPCRQQACL